MATDEKNKLLKEDKQVCFPGFHAGDVCNIHPVLAPFALNAKAASHAKRDLRHQGSVTKYDGNTLMA